MTRLQYFLLGLTSIMLTACYNGDDTWFKHTLDFSGNDQEQKLVLTSNLQVGHTPQISLSTAYFIGDPERVDTIYIEDGPFSHYQTILRPGYLHNADVRIRINGGDWQQLTEQAVTLPLPAHQRNNHVATYDTFVYTCDYVLQPLDSIDILARDPLTGREAKAAVRMPQQIVATVSLADSTDYSFVEEYGKEDILFVNLHLPASASSANLLQLRATTAFHEVHNTTIAAGSHTVIDYGIFAHDGRFARYPHVCKAMSQGWYGSTFIGLFADVPAEDCTLLLAMPYQAKSKMYVNGEPVRITSQLDSVVLDVAIVSPHTYTYYASMAQNGLISYKPYYDYWLNSEANEIEQAVDDIEGIFNRLGDLEAVPVIGNVENAYGRVLTSAACRIVIRP